ncbi:MAG: hypothetical protein Q7S19_01470 [bacterium]|nr:hypothetical protein [bacterium]
MDALNALVKFLGDLSGYAKGAVVAAALLAMVSLLWGPALAVGQALLAAGAGVMSSSGHQLLACLGVLWLCADKKA